MTAGMGNGKCLRDHKRGPPQDPGAAAPPSFYPRQFFSAASKLKSEGSKLMRFTYS